MDILEETASSSSPSPSPSSSSLSSSSSSSSESLAEAEAGPKQEAAVHQPELPSLSMREVLSTGLFYKVEDQMAVQYQFAHNVTTFLDLVRIFRDQRDPGHADQLAEVLRPEAGHLGHLPRQHRDLHQHLQRGGS